MTTELLQASERGESPFAVPPEAEPMDQREGAEEEASLEEQMAQLPLELQQKIRKAGNAAAARGLDAGDPTVVQQLLDEQEQEVRGPGMGEQLRSHVASFFYRIGSIFRRIFGRFKRS